jgi:hypothetical protein
LKFTKSKDIQNLIFSFLVSLLYLWIACTSSSSSVIYM